MITKLLKKYLSIVFVVALFMGSMHHKHDDSAHSHSDCQICTIQSNLLNSDTPKEVVYLSKIELQYELISTQLTTLHLDTTKKLLNARAPPLFS